jgi:AMP-polyphosphate phosphotransferase
MLATIDLSLKLEQEEYDRLLIKYQVALHDLAFQVYLQQRPVVIVFEGWDAAGKGGAIRRVTEKIDPRGFAVYSIAAPKGDDATHHYLWRFWKRLPEAGQISIFDRSWYGRVLVERIEGFCTEPEWKRAYREINYFERQLVDFGTISFKFWLHVSKDEQLRRFESRQVDKRRSWKLTDEDWRNREKWDLYEDAVSEMLLKTSTITAPWTVVEGDDKLYARIKILKTLVERMSKALDYDPFAERKVTVVKPAREKKKKKEKKEDKGR